MNKKTKKILVAVIGVIALLIGGFFVYTIDYYRADETAQQILKENESINVRDSYIFITPKKKSDTTLIFYPGGKVEYISYLPILTKVTEQSHINIILVRMPFNLAVFNQNAADSIIENFPEIKRWYIGGHSLGGAMSSSYASNHPDKVDGLILLGAYVYGDFPKDKSLTIYGTLNATVAEKVDYTENVVIIDGGNHAQFGNYGKQKGDPDATISQEEQQDIAVDAIDAFISR